MSLEWKRLHDEAVCGGACRINRIPAGRPVLDVTTPSGKKFRRCQSCAARQGWTPPDDLPPPAPKVEVTPMVPMRSVRDGLPLDFKMAQAGREPGEDD